MKHFRKPWHWLTALLLLALLGYGAAAMAQTPSSSVGVYYIGPEDVVARAIDLAYPYLVRVDRPELAEVYVLNDAPLTPETLRAFGEQARREQVGMVLFCGRQFPVDTDDLRLLFGIGNFGLLRTERSQSVTVGERSDPIQDAIAWNSAPQLYARTVISNPNLLRPIVTTTSGEPVLQRLRGQTAKQVFIVGPWFSASRHDPWHNWPYFRYLVYRLSAEASGTSRLLSFTEYPLSPVPHGAFRWVIIWGSGGVIVLAAVAFFMSRRYLFLHPEQLEHLRADTLPSQDYIPDSLWATVGFHRPLAGFLYIMAVGLVLFIPLISYQTYLLPQDLIPWPQMLSAWDMVGRWLEIAWVFLDLGIGVAAVRFFAAWRIRNPRESFRYIQFYIWWQILSSAVQFSTVAWLATFVFPRTALAHLAFYFILHALVQFPGILRAFGLIFRGLQRFDYEQTVLLLAIIGPVVIQVVLIPFLRRWGSIHPDIGEGMGGIFGLGLGLYLAEWMAFVAGLFLYKRAGYALRPLLLPDFDRQLVGQILSFGARLMFGAIFVPLAALAQMSLLPDLVDHYVEVISAWAVVYSFTFVFTTLLGELFNDLMPAMTEAYVQGYHTLMRYYISQGFYYGMWFSLFALAVLTATANRFILGVLGGTYSFAGRLVVPVLLWATLQWPAWLADRTLEAAGRPAVTSWLTLGEQSLRLGLMLLLVSRWQVAGILAAYMLALLIRVLLAWILTGRLVARLRVNIWQTLVVPSAAALIVYEFLKGIGDLWWAPTPAAGLLLLGAGLLLMLPFYGFLTGFLGGWDNGGLAELQQAVSISHIGYPLAWLLSRAIHLGAQVSPLHGRLSMALRPMAEEEAHTLTLRQKSVE